MEPNLTALAQVLDLNTDLLLNCFDGVTEDDAHARPLAGANSMAFTAAHVVDGRHFIARMLGQPIENPLQAIVGDAQGIDDVKGLPPVAELSRMWTTVAEHLSRCLEAATAEALAGDPGQRFPVADPTVLGALAFLVQHESYHIGQVALLRKGLGYAAMSYRRRTET